MLETITEKLNDLIAEVDEMRACLGRRKDALLKECPTDAGMSQLVSLKRSLEDLRLAEDVLRDAVMAIETKAGKTNEEGKEHETENIFLRRARS